MQSMTGFAERSFSSRTIQAKMSLKSLNHRFFDWSYKGIAIGEIENRLRALCQKRLRRGRVDFSLELSFPDSSSWEVLINEGMLERVLSSLARISSRLGKEFSFSAEHIFRLPQAVEIKRKNFTRQEVTFLERSFLKTLEEVVKARREEGNKTGLQIKRHIHNIQRAVSRIEKRTGKQPALLRQKLRQRMKELEPRTSLSKEKLAEEAAYLIQKYDFSEELTRLKSHLSAFLKMLAAKKEVPVGKAFDFVTQELFREVNTMNAKTQDFQITKEGLMIKTEIESIRQHVQNLE
ncbi:MAG: DUF1732 domain-containing protein [Candidatus Aminicenantales bacterium]